MTENKMPISTGFPAADELLDGGLRSGEVVCFAGAQKETNTRFLCRAALTAAEQTEKTVLLVSLSATEKEIRDALTAEYGSESRNLSCNISFMCCVDFTVKGLRDRLMADDTVGTVLINGAEWINVFCENNDWPSEYCAYCDQCDENEAMKSCIVYALKKLAKAFRLPVAVTQTVPDTKEKSRAELGISPETDRLLFLRCDGQTWQFWTADEKETAVPLPETDAGAQKSPPDLLRFIPSKDVREHLKTIGWQPDAAQAARLVLGSDAVPLYEKLESLRQITETMPDVFLDLPSFVENGESLHDCLSAYVRDEEELLAYYGNSENATFLAEGYRGKSTLMLRSVVGTTLDGCLKKVLEGIPDDQRSSLRIRVRKYYSNDRYAFSVIYNADRQPIGRYGFLNRKAKEINELLREPLTLPHPFRRFDLVWLPRETDAYFDVCRNPILLDRLPEPAAAAPEDSRLASGYSCMTDGDLDYLYPLPVAELEYLPQGFCDQYTRILSRLREYLSGGIPLCGFVNDFAAFCMQTAADHVGDFHVPDEPAAPVPPAPAFEAFFGDDDDFPF